MFKNETTPETGTNIMDIYIGNIPKGTKPSELKKLLKERIKDCVFRRVYEQAAALGRFDKNIKIQIRKQKFLNRRGYYRFGHMNFLSDRIGQVALDSLDNAVIRGETITARKFVERDHANDRRSSLSEDTRKYSDSRRRKERRSTKI